ncbi:uncharacterized protein LOC121834465 [Ixodes scapularis]|uniref:uncharacterized protein LOC121834465 n=1 Tax=Ixodes scapularis TaxID=6945 RepID=UPI001C3873E8|nr:uncharacterized protein LOC121834465 [Ixodes scapularis]
MAQYQCLFSVYRTPSIGCDLLEFNMPHQKSGEHVLFVYNRQIPSKVTEALCQFPDAAVEEGVFIWNVTNARGNNISTQRHYKFIWLKYTACLGFCIIIVHDCACVILKLLLLSGDVEVNPGPHTRSADMNTTENFSDIMSALKDIKSGQMSLLEEMKSIRSQLSEHDRTFNDIKKRLTNIEVDCSSIVTIKSQVESVQTLAKDSATQIAHLTARFDDSEDRARRTNLIFFGHTDNQRETWDQSEILIIEHCSAVLNVPLQPTDIERAHRIGTFQPNKSRPIIIKFAHFKIRAQVLLFTKKLKGTSYSISEDYSSNTRTARKHLLEFGKNQRSLFKLRHDKLIINTDLSEVDFSVHYFHCFLQTIRAQGNIASALQFAWVEINACLEQYQKEEAGNVSGKVVKCFVYWIIPS